MIDLKTGIIEFDGVRITPDTTIEELKKYGEDVIEINERGNGRANATLKKWIYNNGIEAEIWISIYDHMKYYRVTITPSLKGKNGIGLLDASRQWLKGMTVGGTYIDDDRHISGSYDWGTMVAQYYPDRDYGTVGGEIHIDYADVVNEFKL